jgi:pheromone shutdown protein TraB
MTAQHTDDPRVDTRYVRTCSGTHDGGAVTIVGVVHDHPASVYRVRHVVSEVDPSVLALELPPLAVPLYEAYAAGARSPPALGGELSAAVQAAGTDSVVGIDGPSLGFVHTLGQRLWQERASRTTVSRSLRSLLSVTKSAVACRMAATLAARTPFTVAVGSSVPHETTMDDPANEQAADERRQIRAASAVMDAFETSPSSRYRAESRERHMADRLATLRESGDVVAVVGAGHFDPLCERVGTQ